MRIGEAAVLIAILAFQGCSYTKPIVVAPMQLGPKETPISIIEGESSAEYIFGFRIEGDDSLSEAVKSAKAKSKTPDTTMANVFVDRHYFCFPACWFPIYSESKTNIFGTLITYKEIKHHSDPDQKQAQDPDGAM